MAYHETVKPARLIDVAALEAFVAQARARQGLEDLTGERDGQACDMEMARLMEIVDYH